MPQNTSQNLHVKFGLFGARVFRTSQSEYTQLHSSCSRQRLRACSASTMPRPPSDAAFELARTTGGAPVAFAFAKRLGLDSIVLTTAMPRVQWTVQPGERLDGPAFCTCTRLHQSWACRTCANSSATRRPTTPRVSPRPPFA